MLYFYYGIIVLLYSGYQIYDHYQQVELGHPVLFIIAVLHGLAMLMKSRSKRFNLFWFIGQFLQMVGLYFIVEQVMIANIQGLMMSVVLFVVGSIIRSNSYYIWLPLTEKYFKKYEVTSFYEFSARLNVLDHGTCAKLLDYFIMQNKLDYIESKNGDDVFHWKESIVFEQGAIHHEVTF